MKKLIFINAFCLISLIALPALAMHKNLNLADLQKATYKFALTQDKNEVEVRHLGQKTINSGPTEELWLSKYAFGDLNGDGLGDAVAIVGLITGGSGNFMSLIALVNDHGKAKSVDWVYLGDRTGCTSLRIINKKIIYHALIHEPNGACWGTLPKGFVYSLKKNKLVGPRDIDCEVHGN